MTRKIGSRLGPTVLSLALAAGCSSTGNELGPPPSGAGAADGASGAGAGGQGAGSPNGGAGTAGTTAGAGVGGTAGGSVTAGAGGAGSGMGGSLGGTAAGGTAGNDPTSGSGGTAEPGGAGGGAGTTDGGAAGLSSGGAGGATAGTAGTTPGAGSGGGAGATGDPCDAVDVGAGDMHTCALSRGGKVYCWGSNAEGAVGNGAASRQLTPFEVTAAGTDNVDLLVGHHVTCVKKTSGAVACWGTFDDAPSFRNVRDPRAFDVFGDDFSQLIVDTSACVIRKSDRSVACWGYESTTPTTITAFGTDVVQIDLEFRTVCAVKSGGSVMCRTDNDAPRTVSGVSNAVNVGLRRDHNGLGEPEDVMAAGADGKAYYAHNGGSFQAMNLAGQKAVYFNAQHHLLGAISDTGGVMLWHSAICGGFGDNNPPEDNGSTAGDRRNYTQNAPAIPTGFMSGATRELALGHEHACVIRASDSSVYCWGRNVEGQIGNGTRARECEVGVGNNNPGPDGNQMTPYRVSLCQ